MLMKIFLVFIVLFTTGFFEVAAEADPEQAKFIEVLNENRRFFAKKNGISDMHELIFDEALQKVAARNDWLKTVLNPNFRGRYTLLKNYQNGMQDLMKDTKTFLGYDVSVRDKIARALLSEGHVKGWEHFNPIQTMIGCAPNQKNTMPNEYKNAEYTIVCVLGSKTRLSGWKILNSVPGSQCNPGYVNVEGLCSRPVKQPPSSTVPLPDTTLTSIAPLVVQIPPGDVTTPMVPNNSFIPENSSISATVNPEVPQDKKSPSPISPSIYVPATTVETELDRLIAEYKRNEQDGDVPSEEDEMEYFSKFSGCGRLSIEVTVVFVMILVLF
ncbi:unnamed protein product [Caenorhabditis brenneri]